MIVESGKLGEQHETHKACNKPQDPCGTGARMDHGTRDANRPDHASRKYGEADEHHVVCDPFGDSLGNPLTGDSDLGHCESSVGGTTCTRRHTAGLPLRSNVRVSVSST